MSSSRVPLLVKSKGRKPSGLAIAPKKAPSAAPRVSPVSAPIAPKRVAPNASAVSRSPQKTNHVVSPSNSGTRIEKDTRMEKPIAPVIRPTISARPRSIAPGNSISARRSPLLRPGQPVRSPILRPGLTLGERQPPAERLSKISSTGFHSNNRPNVEPRLATTSQVRNTNKGTLTSASTSSPMLTGSQNPVIQRAIRKLDIKPNNSPRRPRTSSISSPSTTPLVAAVAAGAQAAAAAEDRQQQQERKRAMSITSEDKPIEKKPKKEPVTVATSAKSNKVISNNTGRASLKRKAKSKAVYEDSDSDYQEDDDEEVEYAIPARERATLWAKEVLRQQLGEQDDEEDDEEVEEKNLLTVGKKESKAIKRLRSNSMVSVASSTTSTVGSSIRKSRTTSKMSELLLKETSQMTMGELAMTIPKGRRIIRHEKEEQVSADPFDRSQRLRSLSIDSTRAGMGEAGTAVPGAGGGGTALVAPQVEIVDGKMVIMESTVKYEDTVHYNENDEMSGVHADGRRKSTSGRYSTHPNGVPGKRWSKEETKQFYYCLSQVGPNFSMMATLFPSRKRKELKSKFKYEEKHHSNLVEIALKASAAPLDSEMFGVLHQMVDEDTKRQSQKNVKNKNPNQKHQRGRTSSLAVSTPGSLTKVASSPMPMTPMSLGEYDEEYERGRKDSFDFDQ